MGEAGKSPAQVGSLGHTTVVKRGLPGTTRVVESSGPVRGRRSREVVDGIFVLRLWSF